MEQVPLIDLLEPGAVLSVSDRRRLERLVVSSVSTDTRSLKQGDLFVAIEGERFDGHRFVDQALGRGAAGVVFAHSRLSLLRPLMSGSPALFLGVQDTRAVLGMMARRYVHCFPAVRIAVTGSAGKTTTTALIHRVLETRCRVASSPRSFNNDIGVPTSMFQVDRSTQVLVQEIGTNHPGEIENLSGILEQHHAVVTGVGPSHLEFFGSVEGVAREKKQALLCLPGEGAAFLNAEDPWFSFLGEGISARVRSFGLGGGDLHPRDVRVGLDGATFSLEGTAMKVAIPGLHGVLNATAAALVGFHLGLTAGEVKRGLGAYLPEPGRGRVLRGGGITVIDESYNANPLSVQAALQILQGARAPRKLFVFGDMLELGAEGDRYHRQVGEQALRRGVDLLLTVGPLAALAAGEFGARGGASRSFEAVEELIGALRGELKRGDLLLVKGSRRIGLERVVEALVETG
jgi:UDP-N-acetylmuramoyl-tripeptide--D-alanyl-D-alanine ligase